MSDSRVGTLPRRNEPPVGAEVLSLELDRRHAITRVNRGWGRKILTRIRDYSFSSALTYALARFYSIRRLVRASRRLTRAFAPVPRVVQSDCLVGGPSVDEIVRNVQANAWSVGPSLDEHSVEGILDFASHCEFTSCGLPPGVRFRLRDRARVERECETSIAFADAAEPLESGIIRDVVADGTLNTIAGRYLGYRPDRAQARILASFATEVAASERLKQKQTIFYHYDLDDYHMLIFNFYLTPVDERSGPHVLFPGTHRAKKAPQIFSSLNFTDADIYRAHPGAEPVVLCAGPGFGFVEDPFCLHKANPPTSGSRFMLQLRFM